MDNMLKKTEESVKPVSEVELQNTEKTEEIKAKVTKKNAFSKSIIESLGKGVGEGLITIIGKIILSILSTSWILGASVATGITATASKEEDLKLSIREIIAQAFGHNNAACSEMIRNFLNLAFEYAFIIAALFTLVTAIAFLIKYERKVIALFMFMGLLFTMLMLFSMVGFFDQMMHPDEYLLNTITNTGLYLILAVVGVIIPLLMEQHVLKKEAKKKEKEEQLLKEKDKESVEPQIKNYLY